LYEGPVVHEHHVVRSVRKLNDYFKHKIIYEELNAGSEDLCIADFSSLHVAISASDASQMRRFVKPVA
jgi:hypothetical protein